MWPRRAHGLRQPRGDRDAAHAGPLGMPSVRHRRTRSGARPLPDDPCRSRSLQEMHGDARVHGPTSTRGRVLTWPVSGEDNMLGKRFRDRREAGRLLATKLSAYANRPDVLVLALPRGGVPVAYEVARPRGAPLGGF